MRTEKPCWGPAGSGSKCYPAICSEQLNSRPFVPFEQVSHPGGTRCSEPRQLGTGSPKGALS